MKQPLTRGRSQNSDKENQGSPVPTTRVHSPRHHRAFLIGPSPNLDYRWKRRCGNILMSFRFVHGSLFLISKENAKNRYAVCRCGELIFWAEARTVPG